MKRSGILTSVLAALVLIVSSCGEDDCTSCPENDSSPALYAIGSLATDGNRFTAYIEVYNVIGTGDGVDSVSVDGDFWYCCIRDFAHTVANDGRQIIAGLGGVLCPSGVYIGYFPGETTELALYCRNEAHRASLHILDIEGSRPRNVEASADEPANMVHISWDAVADAEWYAVKMRSKFNSGGAYQWDYYCVQSTSVDAPLPYPYIMTIDVQIYVASGTGPMPTKEHPENNISGNHIAGTLYSLSSDVHLSLELNPWAGELYPPDDSFAPPSIIELIRRDGRLLPSRLRDK